jgi:hypothetical protein
VNRQQLRQCLLQRGQERHHNCCLRRRKVGPQEPAGYMYMDANIRLLARRAGYEKWLGLWRFGAGGGGEAVGRGKGGDGSCGGGGGTEGNGRDGKEQGEMVVKEEG